MSDLSKIIGRAEDGILERHNHVTAKEARNNFSEIMHATNFKEERIVITHRGKPKMALVPIADLKRLEELDGEAASIPLSGSTTGPLSSTNSDADSLGGGSKNERDAARVPPNRKAQRAG
ncbi:MAG: type II toxin-antitoxin system Phd/YefM family antitoxin [Hyphomicrobiaceae bacterium]|nr:type II toxin-antitoxin system Phd/YefM family antitoxin [Hyphomicrobiaceae bacterium]